MFNDWGFVFGSQAKIATVGRVHYQAMVIGIDTNIGVIVVSLTNWEAHPARGRSLKAVVSFPGC